MSSGLVSQPATMLERRPTDRMIDPPALIHLDLGTVLTIP